MSIAVQLNSEKQQACQLIAELQNERQEVWSFYCHIAELIPFAANRAVKNKLALFSEILIDYVSLGHFGVCEYLCRYDRAEALSTAEEIYPMLSATTEAAVRFNDKYENGAAVADELKRDLSILGESLARRMDLEDRLCRLMLQ
ncbi:MAG: Rsd/AlgQ family anti-sigma factor [Methylobacter sp.]